MKISDNTLSVLKSFANINPSIWVEGGNVLRTVSPQKTVMARCEVEDDFETPFGIYDLNQFLSTVSLFDKPDFHFNEKSVTVSSENTSVRYAYCDKNIIAVAPNKEIQLPDEIVKFHLTHSVLHKSLQASNVLSLPNVSVVGSEGHIQIVVGDMKNGDSNTYRTIVGETSNEFNIAFKVENLRVIQNDYDVRISSKGISHFSAMEGKLQYWIATESR